MMEILQLAKHQWLGSPWLSLSAHLRCTRLEMSRGNYVPSKSKRAEAWERQRQMCRKACID